MGERKRETRRRLKRPLARALVRNTERKPPSEADEQAQLVQWLRASGCLVFAVPNGAHLKGGARAWRALERIGALKGAPDLVVVAWVNDREVFGRGAQPNAVVLVEMKRRDGELSAEQAALHLLAKGRGTAVVVAYGFDDGKAKLLALGVGR